MVCLNTHHISYVIGTQYKAFWRQIQSINVVMKCGRNLAANPLSPRLIMFTEGGQLSWRPPQMEDTSISHQLTVCYLTELHEVHAVLWTNWRDMTIMHSELGRMEHKIYRPISRRYHEIRLRKFMKIFGDNWCYVHDSNHEPPQWNSNNGSPKHALNVTIDYG